MRGLLLGLFLLPLAAGCGTEAGSRAASDEPVPTDANSSRIEMSVDGGGAHPMTYVLQGAMDYAHHRGEFSMRVYSSLTIHSGFGPTISQW